MPRGHHGKWGQPFETGRAKTGGRVKGSKDRVKLEFETLSGLALLQYHDPIKVMIQVMEHPKATLELRGRMGSELAKYCYVQKKAVEVTGPDGQPLRTRLEIVVTRIDQDGSLQHRTLDQVAGRAIDIQPVNQDSIPTNQDNNILNQDVIPSNQDRSK